KPLGMLVEHRVNHVHERFIGGQKAVSSRQQVTLQHSFHGVFAQHLHDSAVGGKLAAVHVVREKLLDPEFLADRVNGIELVGSGFIRAEDPKVFHVQLHHVSQESAQGPCV